MDGKYVLQLTILIILYFLTKRGRVSAVIYNTENATESNIILDLSNSGLKYLNANFINSNCLKNLILRNNSMEDLKPGIFDSQIHLEYLDLSKNYLELQNLLSYGGRSSLKVLILDHNKYYFNNITESTAIDYGTNTTDENYDDIEYIKDKRAQFVIPGVFPELQHLSLRNLHVNTLPNDWFIYFPKLNHLDLSENMISSVTLDFLLNNISSTVVNLILENVGLTTLRTEHLGIIENLNLNHNRFLKIVSHACHYNTLCIEDNNNLKFLSISNCCIVYIAKNAFRYMKYLLELDISNNCFSNIFDETFNYIPSLTSLNLSQNSLHSMPNIGNLQNLSSLILNEMKIRKMITFLRTFPSLPNLKYISMCNNKLKAIPSTLFENLPSLETVDLSNNKIKYLPYWESSKFIHRIYLNSNKIENLTDVSIKKAVSLELLVLKNNSISKINVEDFPNENHY